MSSYYKSISHDYYYQIVIQEVCDVRWIKSTCEKIPKTHG